MTPTKEQAHQFVLMLQAGLPAKDAIAYFQADLDLDAALSLAKTWCSCKAVAAAEAALNKGDWVGLSPQARIQLALDRHYSQMAYLLYTHNYAETTDQRILLKLDKARTALEIKLAGMAGSMNPLAQFYQDHMQTNKVVMQ